MEKKSLYDILDGFEWEVHDLEGNFIAVEKIKTYRVYQNMTQFAIDIEAGNKEEALDKAKQRPALDWSEYEPNEDNITYEVVQL